jgi:hypothetical protein
MIVQQKSHIISIITILNYDEHQGNDTTDSTADSTTDGQQTIQQTDTNNKDKKDNKKKNTEAPPFKSYFPTDWQKHEKFVGWCDKWDELRRKKRWPRTKLAYEAQAEKLLEHDIDTAIRAIRDSIQGGWQGVFPKKEKGSGPSKGMTAEQEAAREKAKRELRIAEDSLRSAQEAQKFTPSPENEDRLQKVTRYVNKLRKAVEG